MKKNYKILSEFTKDVSCEIPDVETFLLTKDNISKYDLNVDIKSKPLKNKIIEVNIILKFRDKNLETKSANFEIVYTVVSKIEENISDKKEMEKIVLSDIPNEVASRLTNLFISLVNQSGFPEFKMDFKFDFEKMYKERLN